MTKGRIHEDVDVGKVTVQEYMRTYQDYSGNFLNW